MDSTAVRGKIQYRDRARQIIDFSSLRYGKITPTDIDGAIDFRNMATVILEYKYRDAECPYGQRLSMQRQLMDAHRSGKYAIGIIAEHNVDDPNEDIDGANAIVREFMLLRAERQYPSSPGWKKPKNQVSVKLAVDYVVRACGLEGELLCQT